MSFSDIGVRSNGQRVTREWFNALRTAGIAVETFLGGGFSGGNTFTIADAQASPANITSLIFSSASVRTAVIDYQIYRSHTADFVEVGVLHAYFTTSDGWQINRAFYSGEAGVAFSIDNSTGQVKYTSDDKAGALVASTMKYNYRTNS